MAGGHKVTAKYPLQSVRHRFTEPGAIRALGNKKIGYSGCGERLNVASIKPV